MLHFEFRNKMMLFLAKNSTRHFCIASFTDEQRPAVKHKTTAAVIDSDEGQHSQNLGVQDTPGMLPNERISLPVLDGDTEQDYAREVAEQAAVIWNCDKHRMDQPLTFLSGPDKETDVEQTTPGLEGHEHGQRSPCRQSANSNPLGLDYDSSDDNG